MSNFRALRRTLAASAVVSGLVLAGCSGVQGSDSDTALELQFNSFLGPGTPQAIGMQWLWDEVEEQSEGSMSIEQFWGGALVNGPDTLEAVAQGRVDLGHMTVLYNPSQLPLSQAIAIPFVTDDVSNVAAIFRELYETNDEYHAEWDAQGVVPLFFLGVPASAIGGKTEITGPEWIAGKSIRSTGYLADAVQALDGTPVALQATDVYEAIQRGTADGWTNNILDTAIGDQSLDEVAPWVADAGTGLYTVNAVVVSKTRYESFTDEQKMMFADIAEGLDDHALDALDEADNSACEKLIAAGGGATAWTPEQIESWKSLVGDSALESWKSDVQSAGGDPEGFYDAYSTLIQERTSPDFVNGIERCVETTSEQAE